MNILIIVLIAIAPCIFWLWFIYKRDRYKPEPRWLIVRTFIFGMLAAIPVALIETGLYPSSLRNSVSLSTAIYVAFIVAGLTEELAKFLVIRLGVYNSPHFEEPADGLVYAAAAALGFASLENIIYLFGFGWEAILVRGLFSNLAHVLFSSLWGYALVLTKLKMTDNKYLVLAGLLAAILAHGLFDFLFFTSSVFTWAVIPLFLGMLIFYILMFRHANRHAIYVKHRMDRVG